MLIDSHCHLDREYFPNGLDKVIKQAAENNVGRMLYNGCNMQSSLNAVAASSEHEEIFAAVGLHPEDVSEMPNGITAELKTLAQKPKVVAVGEIGIDYYWDVSTRVLQQEIFAQQIEWAKEIEKPVVVHVRDAKNKADGDAMKDTLEILLSHKADKCCGIIHCFNGNYEEGCKALDLGFYISFSGIITFKKSAALREIASKIPADRILCETDTPYLAPVPYRGKSNTPAYVAEVYKCLAEIKNMKTEQLEEIVEINCNRLFKWSQ